MWSSTTGLVTLATFGTYTALGNRLSLDVALPVFSLITILQFPLAVLPWMFISGISFRIALRRLEKFLLLPSIVDRRVFNDDAADKSIACDSLRLRWTRKKVVLDQVSWCVFDTHTHAHVHTYTRTHTVTHTNTWWPGRRCLEESMVY